MNPFITSSHKRTTTCLSDDTLRAFKIYLTEQNLSGSTIVSYLFGVQSFFKRYTELTPDNLQLYKVWLLEHYEPQTVNSRIRSLNAFLRFQQKDSEFHLKTLRIQQKAYLDHIISQGDYEYLTRRLKEDGEFTFYFIVRFLAATGVRVSELICMEAEDTERGYRDIYSKGGKMRRIYIPASLQTETLSWLSSQGRKKGPLFLSHLGTRISSSGVHSRLKTFALRYHLDPQVVYPHSFRHRFAKNFIEHGGDLAFLSRLLGHESIETTRIYLRKTSTEQAQILDRVVDW